MNLNKIDDVNKLKGGIDVSDLEKLIVQLLNLFSLNNTNWNKGIELLNDLIYLKNHDNATTSKETSRLILDWIQSKYDNKVFIGFSGSYGEDDTKAKNLVFLMDLTLDTIFKIHYNFDVLPFLYSILKKSTNEYETYSIKDLIDYIKSVEEAPKQVISEKTLNQVLSQVDSFFKSQYNPKSNKHLFCGLKETIKEHKLCFSIGKCLKSEKYLSDVKKAQGAGSGPLMISKAFDKFEMMGSAPGIDWIHLFELELQDLEEYFYLEVPFEKKNISKIKSVIKCSTTELLKLVNKNQKIIYTESKKWNDFTPRFQEISNDLNNLGIECQVEIKTRKNCY